MTFLLNIVVESLHRDNVMCSSPHFVTSMQFRRVLSSSTFDFVAVWNTSATMLRCMSNIFQLSACHRRASAVQVCLLSFSNTRVLLITCCHFPNVTLTLYLVILKIWAGLGCNEVQVLCYNTLLLFWVLCNVTKYFKSLKYFLLVLRYFFRVLFYFVTKYCDRKVVLERSTFI